MRSVLFPERRQPAPAGPRMISVADAEDIAHLVTSEEMSARIGEGRYGAICGRSILAGSLTAPATGDCQECLTRHRKPRGRNDTRSRS